MSELISANPVTTNGATNGRLKLDESGLRVRRTSPARALRDSGDPPPTARQLVIAIVQDEDAKATVDALTASHFRVTQLTTSGGFLRKGNATLIVGAERAQLPEAVRIVERACRTRTEQFTPTPIETMPGPILLAPIDVRVGGATIFVLDVQHFERV